MTLKENGTEVQKYIYIYIYIFYLSSNQTRAPLLAPDYKRLLRYGSYQLLQLICALLCFQGALHLPHSQIGIRIHRIIRSIGPTDLFFQSRN